MNLGQATRQVGRLGERPDPLGDWMTQISHPMIERVTRLLFLIKLRAKVSKLVGKISSWNAIDSLVNLTEELTNRQLA